MRFHRIFPSPLSREHGSLCRCPNCSRLRARAHDNSLPAHVVTPLSVGLTAKASQRTGRRIARRGLLLVRAICCREHISCRCIAATVRGQDCSAGRMNTRSEGICKARENHACCTLLRREFDVIGECSEHHRHPDLHAGILGKVGSYRLKTSFAYSWLCSLSLFPDWQGTTVHLKLQVTGAAYASARSQRASFHIFTYSRCQHLYVRGDPGRQVERAAVE